MFRQGDKVLVHGFGGHSTNEYYIVEDERITAQNEEYAGTVFVRMKGQYGDKGVQPFHWPVDQVTRVTPSDRRKTQFYILFEMKDNGLRGVSTCSAYSADAALERQKASFEDYREGREGTYRVLAVVPSSLVDLLPSDAFETKIDWRYDIQE